MFRCHVAKVELEPKGGLSSAVSGYGGCIQKHKVVVNGLVKGFLIEHARRAGHSWKQADRLVADKQETKHSNKNKTKTSAISQRGSGKLAHM